MKKIIMMTGLIMAAFMPVWAHAEDTKVPAAAPAAAEAVSAPVEVGNKICPVSGDAIKADPTMEAVKIEHNGKMYGLCCPMCIKDFKNNPDKYAAIADAEVKAAAKTQ